MSSATRACLCTERAYVILSYVIRAYEILCGMKNSLFPLESLV